MGKAIRASALILLLACSAQAGWMGNGSPVPPPPSDPSVAQEGYMSNDSLTPSTVEDTTANGWMGNDAAASLTQVAWELFAVWPSLL
ncbi:MAG TPA: hypothetical protein VF621_15045 [Pyrinomonadaceae bacterium]